MKDDLYITTLKYGKETLLSGVTYREVKEHLKSKGFGDFDEGEKQRHYSVIFKSVFSDVSNRGTNDKVKWFMQMEAYFRLLEYVELKEARASSTKATIFAGIAIVISIFATSASIYYSNKQISTPTTIESSQFEQIKKLLK